MQKTKILIKILLIMMALFSINSCSKGNDEMFGKKEFKLKADQIKPIATGHGACFATNMITIEGKPINIMYREKPHNESDSGWKFFSGFEDENYINNPKNTQIFDVNTIANYDKDIITFLDSPIKTAFERNQKTGKFEQVFDFEFPE